MILFRKILFYLFVAIYLVLCPIVIFYAFGYIFTPKVEEKFVKTGLIHLETLPANASISIAQKRLLEKTPATIRNLLAGQYDVRIFLNGYRPWKRKVTVEPGKAMNAENILLIPQKFKTRTLIERSFKDLWPVPRTRYLLLKDSELAGDLKVFDWKNEKFRSVLPEGSPLASARLEKVFMSKESSFVLVQAQGAEGYLWGGCQLDKDKPEVKDLTDLFLKEAPREILWEKDRPDYLFALYDQNLARLDLEKMTAVPEFIERVRGFGLFRDKVYALQGASIVQQNFKAKPGEETLVEKGVFLENLFSGDSRFQIDFISNHTICFTGAKGELFSNALPYRFVDEGIKGYQANAGGRKIVLWKDKKIGVLDFEKPERKKEFFERGPEIEWVFEAGESVRQAYFVYNAGYILLAEGKDVSLFRIGESGIPAEKLVRTLGNSSVFYSERTGRLYYLEASKGCLVSVDILPEGFSFAGVISEFEKETQEAVS